MHPASRPGARTSAASRAEQGGPALPPPQRLAPGGGEDPGFERAPAGRGCGRKYSLLYLGEEADGAAVAATAGGGGSGGGGGAGHSPLPLSRPAARSGPLRLAQRPPRARSPLLALTLQRPALPAANATYPGNARSGARERTHRQKVKLRQAGSGCWLVLSPSFLPTPSPRSPVRCPERWRLTSGA